MARKTAELVGVGVGPGDPALITLGAVEELKRCPVIAAPVAREGGSSLALEIAERAVDLSGKVFVSLVLPVLRDKQRVALIRRRAAEDVERHLREGRDVCMPCLGDPSLFATFGFVRQLVQADGFRVRSVAGVPIFSAAASRLGIGLCDEQQGTLHIADASQDPASVLSLPGTRVFIRAARDLPALVKLLQEQGVLDHASLVVDCGMPEERVVPDMSDVSAVVAALQSVRRSRAQGYFATVVVRP